MRKYRIVVYYNAFAIQAKQDSPEAVWFSLDSWGFGPCDGIGKVRPYETINEAKQAIEGFKNTIDNTVVAWTEDEE